MITSIINALNPWKKWREAEKELMNYRMKLINLEEISKEENYKNTPGISEAAKLLWTSPRFKNNPIFDKGNIHYFIHHKNEHISNIKNTLWSMLFFSAINIALLYTMPVLGIVVLFINIISAGLMFKQLYEQHKVVNHFQNMVNETLNEALIKVIGLNVNSTLPDYAQTAREANQAIQLIGELEAIKYIGESKNIEEINQKLIDREYVWQQQLVIDLTKIKEIRKINEDIIKKAEFNILNDAVNKAIGCSDNINSYEHIINKIPVLIEKIEQHPTFIEGKQSTIKTAFEGMRLRDEMEMIFSDGHKPYGILAMHETHYEKHEIATVERPQVSNKNQVD